MKKYLRGQLTSFQSVLEPSAGDGRFIDAFVGDRYCNTLVGIELCEMKSNLLLKKAYPENVSIIISDFLEYAGTSTKKFDLVIGNPPYINRTNMNKAFLKAAKELCKRLELPESIIRNSWVAFALASVNLLEDAGTIFFVLPLEFLQVHYSERLRGFLEDKFNEIHVLTFQERMFPDIEQEVCLVYLTNREDKVPYISYKQYEKLDSAAPKRESKIERNKPLKKWTNAILSDADIDLLRTADQQFVQIKNIGDCSPGIVTGANNELIFSEAEVKKYSCKDYTIPIIAKGKMARNQFELTASLIESLALQGEKVFLLNLLKEQEDGLPLNLKTYLYEAKNTERRGKKIIESYKCANRDPWYGVPIIKSGNVVFFRRYDMFPRICTNSQGIHTADIAYNIRLKEEFDPESIVFTFYNSLTLAQCEFSGRYYAGGVLELTPSEFKSLCVPYLKIAQADITVLREMFKKQESLEDVIQFVNSRTLTHYFDELEIMQIEDIRVRLTERRRPKSIPKD